MQEEHQQKTLAAEQLRAQAHEQEHKAGDLERTASEPDVSHSQQADMRHDAHHARNQAHEMNGRAAELVAQHGAPQAELGEPAEYAKADQERARAWYLPGSVAESDLQLQFQEANQGPSLMGSLASYAARGVTDRDGHGVNAVSGAARGAVGAAKAVGGEALHVGKEVASHAGQTLKEAGRGVAQGAAAAGRAAAAPFREAKGTTSEQFHNRQARDLVKQHAPKQTEQQAPAKDRAR